jgi:primosomal protein N' (replication factor Y) (superfamily II helicase)
MPEYVEVAVNIPRVTGTFSYHLPTELAGRVLPGSLVTVPFGGQHVQGIVTRHLVEPDVPETRPVEGLVDELPVLYANQMKLAAWLAKETLAPFSTCLDVMIPPGLSQHVDILVRLSATPENSTAAGLSPTETKLIRLLSERGEMRGRQIEASLPKIDWRSPLRSLEKKGLVVSTSYLPPPSVRPKYIKTAQLSLPVEEIDDQSDRLGHQPAVIARRLAVLKYLSSEPWPVDIAWVYAASHASLADLQKLEELGLIRLSESEIWRDPVKQIEAPPTSPPELTDEQQAAWTKLHHILSTPDDKDRSRPVLINGVTGSGKTELYLRAIQEVIQQGGQAIYLIPEISLTPQTIRRVLSRFPGRVGIIHSRLSAGERYDTWRRARAGLLSVVVGPRSALFTPFSTPRLIVVDECHDEAYYQSESFPYYHAVHAAVAYGHLAGATVLMGSATPDITQSYRAETGEWLELRLQKRINVTAPGQTSSNKPALMPDVHLADMREELKQGNRSIFSRLLLDSLESTLSAGQQAILFLNRRGSATYIFCRNCGLTIKCPRCDRPLTLHSPLAELLCHTCGYHRKQPRQCPQCASDQIQALGVGTERVESEFQHLFPKARTLRWDHDTTRQKGAHEIILAQFSQQRADVLIGTQMLAKGLDLPFVTLVGVILADISLNLPDYRSAERTFQILTQVAGRAGRSSLGGHVILQSYQPDHYAIQAASHQDQVGFYRQELEFRRQLGYPPFTRLMRLEYRHHQNDQAEAAAIRMADQVISWLQKTGRHATDLIGPAPCFFAREYNLFRWQVVLRGADPAAFFSDHPIPEGWKVELDPPSLL